MPRLLSCVVLLLLSSTSWATFEMAQTRIFFHADQKAATAVLKNTGQQAAIYEVALTNRLEGQGNPGQLTVFPQRFRLEPGQRQVMRLLFQNRAQVRPPQFFYLDIEERVEARSELASRFVPIKFGIPIYFVDPKEKPAVSYDLFRDGGPDGRVVGVNLRNTSQTVVILNEVRLGGSRFPLDAVLLPNETKVINPRGWQPPYVFEIRNFGLMEVK